MTVCAMYLPSAPFGLLNTKSARAKASALPITGEYPEAALYARVLAGRTMDSPYPHFSLRQARIKTELDPSTVGKLMNGHRVSEETVRKFVAVFGGSVNTLLELMDYELPRAEVNDLSWMSRLGVPMKLTAIARRIPHLTAQASAGPRALLAADETEGTLADRIPDEAVSIEIVGDCMMPYYQPGDTVIVMPTHRAAPGQKVIAHLSADDSLTCKIYCDGPDGPYLESVNGRRIVIPNGGFQIKGVVIGMMRLEKFD